jgi:hypothetical protein
VKLVDISGRKEEYLKAKVNEIETNSKKKISEACIGISMTLRRVPA